MRLISQNYAQIVKSFSIANYLIIKVATQIKIIPAILCASWPNGSALASNPVISSELEGRRAAKGSQFKGGLGEFPTIPMRKDQQQLR
jgi:hypothetical protein